MAKLQDILCGWGQLNPKIYSNKTHRGTSNSLIHPTQHNLCVELKRHQSQSFMFRLDCFLLEMINLLLLDNNLSSSNLPSLRHVINNVSDLKKEIHNSWPSLCFLMNLDTIILNWLQLCSNLEIITNRRGQLYRQRVQRIDSIRLWPMQHH